MSKKQKFIEYYNNGPTSKKLCAYIANHWEEYRAWSYGYWEQSKG